MVPQGHTRARFRVHLAVSRWFWPGGGCGKSWPPRRGSAHGTQLLRRWGLRAIGRQGLRGSVYLGDVAVHWHQARDRVLAPCGGESRAARRANSTKCICICQYINLFYDIRRVLAGVPLVAREQCARPVGRGQSFVRRRAPRAALAPGSGSRVRETHHALPTEAPARSRPRQRAGLAWLGRRTLNGRGAGPSGGTAATPVRGTPP